MKANQKDLISKALKAQPGFVEKTIPYRLFWIERFCQDAGSLESFRKGKVGATRYLLFREELREEARWEEWQVSQAEETVCWFLKYFLGIVEADLVVEVEREHFAQWKDVLSKMKERMGVKHMSLRTEKTYLAWVQRFSRFAADRDLRLVKLGWRMESLHRVAAFGDGFLNLLLGKIEPLRFSNVQGSEFFQIPLRNKRDCF